MNRQDIAPDGSPRAESRDQGFAANPIDPSADPSQDSPPPQNPETAPKVPTAEEQMESFEDALKESDWGHQPC